MVLRAFILDWAILRKLCNSVLDFQEQRSKFYEVFRELFAPTILVTLLSQDPLMNLFLAPIRVVAFNVDNVLTNQCGYLFIL